MFSELSSNHQAPFPDPLAFLGHCFLHLIKVVSTEQMSQSCQATARSVRAAGPVPVPAGGVTCPHVPMSQSLQELPSPVLPCTFPAASTPAVLLYPLAPAQLCPPSSIPWAQERGGPGWEGKGDDGLGKVMKGWERNNARLGRKG